jgi:uncharacterized membrane protein
MQELLIKATEIGVLVIDAMALSIVLVSTTAAFVAVIRSLFSAPTRQSRRRIWLQYARWLVAALTFQLAADIIESAIATDWDSLGHLAAMAVVRTFLDYFLERDMEDMRERGLADASSAATPP